MTSLSPNEDRVRAMQPPASLVEQAKVPGLPGVEARLNLALQEAQAVAIAAELDRGTPADQIVQAVANALAAGVASCAAGFGQKDGAHDVGRVIITLLNLKAGVFVGNFVSGRASYSETETEPVARA